MLWHFTASMLCASVNITYKVLCKVEGEIEK